MISNEIKNCNLPEEDKFNLNLILDSGDIEFVQNYLKEIEMKKSTAVKNLPTMEICKLYEQGWSVKAIAEKYNCTTTSITKHLAKGGFRWDKHQVRWAKGQARKVVSNQSSMNFSGRNRQAAVATWLLSGKYTQNTITTDIVANVFGCTSDQASGYLTGIAEKGVLGMRRVGRKLYQFNPVLSSVTEQNEVAVPAAVVESVKHSIPSIKSEKNVLEHIPAIIDLASTMGGLDKLIEMAEWLNKRPLK